MKTRLDILTDIEDELCVRLPIHILPSDVSLNDRWFSETEILSAIYDVKKWEHHSLSEDWEKELVKKLFNTPDLNSRSSDEDD
jgi:hypothetical protein